MFAVPQSPDRSQPKLVSQSSDPRLSRRGPNLGATRVKRADGTISMPPSPALSSATNLNSQSRLLQSPAGFRLHQSADPSVSLLNLSTNENQHAFQTNGTSHSPSINETDAALAMYQLQSLSAEAASDVDVQSSTQSTTQSEFTSSVTEFNAEEEYLLSLVTGSLKNSLKRKRKSESKPKQKKEPKEKAPKKRASKRKRKSSLLADEAADSDDELLVDQFFPRPLVPTLGEVLRSQRHAALRASAVMAAGSDSESSSSEDDYWDSKPKRKKQARNKSSERRSRTEVSRSESSQSSSEQSDAASRQSRPRTTRSSTTQSSPPPPPAPRHTLSVRALLKDNKRGELSTSRKATLERALVDRETKAATAAEQSNNPSLDDSSSVGDGQRPVQGIVDSEEIILAVNSDEEESKYADQLDDNIELDGDDGKAEDDDELIDDAADDEPVGTLSMAPQMKIVNGQLVLNEDSLFLAAAEAPPLETYTLVHENSTARLTSASFGKHSHSLKWTVDETALFYRSISQFGTDFDLICQQFPGRNRKQVKSKYKSEERANRLLLDAALTRRLPIDVEQYEKLKQEKIDSEAAMKVETAAPSSQRVQLSEV